MTDAQASELFFQNFAGYLKQYGYSSQQALKYVWRPHESALLNVTGEQRDHDLSKLTLNADDLEAAMQGKPASELVVDRGFYQGHKIILVMVPGFTHETLKNLSLHEEVERKDSPHHVMILEPSLDGGATREKTMVEGTGFKFVYAKYPRSNAASEYIAEPFFNLLHNSKSLRYWVEEQGYKLFFMGYSYGCPLSLELFANMNSGKFRDEFILKNTLGFLAMCGAIGGSYLADDILQPNSKLLYIPKLVEFCRRHKLISKLLGLPNDQFRNDMEGGVRSLTRVERARKMAEYAPQLPAHLKYFSISAVMPMQDYKRKWWQFNLDDFSMYLQAKISEPISIYNDGQVVMTDNLIPRPPHIAAEQFIHFGAVRAHHWSVSYKTFNFGINRFPRKAFYKALIQTIFQCGVANNKAA